MPPDFNDPDQSDAAFASFGFATVAATEKANLVRDVFDSVAPRYDLMNDLMSAGVHRLWKSTLIDRLAPQPGRRLLDMAGGTGDVAASFLARAKSRKGAQGRPPASAIICDVNDSMLRVGKASTAPAGAAALGAMWVCGDAEQTPLPDASVDLYTISFGIRNVTRIEKALREARRVLRYGGRFLCLEFSQPTVGALRAAYDAYSFNVIPALGEFVTSDRESYVYLVESIRRFPTQERFARMIADAGFRRVGYENLSGGVAAIHFGAKV
ncbi:MAG: ubiquinone/menaquinone biosynthesis methyltransferase [Alphaproteobacteria bacterium]|nr:ubiquinone/menaquinone biosynthesis methyltransferase [Alphaproteobacteria bacterium]